MKATKINNINNNFFSISIWVLIMLLSCTSPSYSPELSLKLSDPSSEVIDNGKLVLEKANAFSESLSETQRKELFQPYTFDNASRWHTYPQWYLKEKGRVGLRLETLSPEQWIKLDELLAVVTSSRINEGFDEIQQHLNADDYLREIGKNNGYGRKDFYIAFLGNPSEKGRWQLQFGGHHFALNNTYDGGVLVSATPSFRCIEPSFPFEYKGKVHHPQGQETDAIVKLLASLDEQQLKEAKLSKKFSDVVLSPGNDWIFPQNPQGIKVTSLNETQQELLIAAILTYVGDIDYANAERFMSLYKSEVDNTYLSYSGTTRLNKEKDYVRIDGPSLWIEFVMDAPYNFSEPHPHGVWRDKRSDYGGLRPEK